MHDEHPSMPPTTAGGGQAWPAAQPSRFLNLASEASLSTRGQHLPGLIQNRSSTNLAEFRAGTPSRVARRDSRFPRVESDLELARSLTQDPSANGGGWRYHEPQESGGRTEAPSLRSMLHHRGSVIAAADRDDPRKPSTAASVLLTPQMRSQRLIGNSNPRYRWERYYSSEDELKRMTRPLRRYYERNNYLIQQYLYIDRILDSSLPHTLIQEYNQADPAVPPTIPEHPSTGHGPSESDDSDDSSVSPRSLQDSPSTTTLSEGPRQPNAKVKRTPKDLYKVPDNEQTPLLSQDDEESVHENQAAIPAFDPEDEAESGDRIVTLAIYINMAANTILLILKIIVMALTNSLSVLASLVDAVLDFLSTGIVWTTTYLISRADRDTQNYPVGRSRLEPIGVLVFSVIMMTSFFQVALESFNALTSSDHAIVQLSVPAVVIMATTVAVKGLCWFWCRLIRNSSVQALAQDAMTDMVFNTFSIIFPLAGYFLQIWWLDPLGGLLLSLYVIISWAVTTKTHILNLTGLAAGKDERNVLLYLTMRFAHTIRYIQGLAAYHAGDKINVEVDIVLDESMSLRDSHDLGESLQYVLESVPGVERAFVHADYRSVNLPTHMRQ